ncbi:unnamed protein product [Coccothraustes coccothraustes]
MGDSRYGMTNPVRAQLVLRKEPVPRSWRAAQNGCGSVGVAGAGPRSARREDGPVPAGLGGRDHPAAGTRASAAVTYFLPVPPGARHRRCPRHLPGPGRIPRPRRMSAKLESLPLGDVHGTRVNSGFERKMTA